MSYIAMELVKRAEARSKDWAEPSLMIPLPDDLAGLLSCRTRRPLSRPETAQLRQLISLAFDRAVGKRK
jgi:hypothetical protein